jgi:TonB-linked SusC/RagA family outer membrane protein
MLHLKTTKTNSNEKHYYINYWHLSHIDAGIVHQCLWSGISDSPDDYSATAITSNPQTQEAVDPSENLPKAGNLSAVLILEQTINGTVTDGDGGEPLPGVNVLAKGTTMGTVTDIEGKYQLTVSDDVEALVFSSIGYETREVAINGQEVINLELMPDVQALSEVVVVGYGIQQKKSLTGSVNSVDAEELKEVTVPNATQLLQGRVPGVITKQSSGLPGQDNANISIRGFGNPLILVDGMERSLSNVDPNDIESISVLKDASAAIYGARSGNGVILVTTKRGNQGKPQFTYDGTYSVQQFTKKPQVITDAGIYTQFWNEAESNIGVPTTYSEEDIENYQAGIPGYESYDWYDFAIKEWTPMNKHNLSVNGGGENITYYAGMGYTDQQSVVSSNDFYYKRFNVRSNVNAKITENISARLDLDYAYEFQRTIPQDGGSEINQLMRAIYKSQPMTPTTFPDTSLIPTSNFNGTHNRLYGTIYKDIRGSNDLNRNILTGNFELDYQAPMVKGLSANFRFIYRSNELRDNQFDKSYDLHQRDPDTGEYTRIGTFGANNKNLLNIRDREFTRIKPILQVRYNRESKRHSFDALFITQFIGERTNQITAQTENLLTDELPYLSFGDPVFNRVGQFVTENGRASVAGRVKYGFLDKYLVEGTFRYDASSLFPSENRWGFFPSISAGWVLSEEGFMQNSTDFINFLKLRASFSQTGYDQNAIPYDYFSGYNVLTNPPYLIGSTQFRRLRAGSLPNTDMTWEDMTIYNIGLDATLWEGLLSVQMDAFYRRRSNVLAIPQRAFPSTFGANLPLDNLNESDNRGIELMLTHDRDVGDFSYSISGNATYARAKWINFEEENYETEAEQRVFQNSGRWVNRSVGYVTDGIFRTQEEIDSHPIDQDQNENSTIIPGDIKYVDIDGDGIITFEDQQDIGYGTGDPEFNFGLNFLGRFKNLSLSILFQGGSMFAGNVSGLARIPFDNASTPFELHWENSFDPERNPDGTLPLVSVGIRENNDRFSDFWHRNITYIRIENVRLTYTLPNSVLGGLGINRFQAYLSGNNLYDFSNLGIYARSFDPEAPLSQFGYPPNRTITLGLNVQF